MTLYVIRRIHERVVCIKSNLTVWMRLYKLLCNSICEQNCFPRIAGNWIASPINPTLFTVTERGAVVH